MNRWGKIASVLGVTAVLAGAAALAQSSAQAAAPAGLRYFTQPAAVQGSTTPYGNNAAHGHYIQAGDAKLYYEIYGKGTPVFVFHGGGVGTPYEMGCLIDKLRQDHEVIVVSTRGHGRSEIGHSPITYEQKATDMITVMKAVTGQPAIILGFSDGAYTAYKVADLYPQGVDRIVAIGAGTLKAGYFKPGLTVEDLEKMDQAFVDQQRRLMPEPERYQEFLTQYMDFWSRMNVGKETFSAIQCPVLLIVGDEDDHAPVATVLEAHQLIPNSRLCVVPKAWHTAFLDNFPVTWAAIEHFIAADRDSLTGSKKLAANDR